jgi:hypothetical protein
MGSPFVAFIMGIGKKRRERVGIGAAGEQNAALQEDTYTRAVMQPPGSGDYLS